jgi:enamine deaminase RidA (YjgF/YER057c/UK114 family)
MAEDPFAMIKRMNEQNAAAPAQPAIDLGFGGGAPQQTATGVSLDFTGGAAAPADQTSPKAPSSVHPIATLEAMAMPAGVSQAMVVPAGASMVYVSGMYPVQTPMMGGAPITGSIGEQTAAALANVSGCLKEAGLADLKTVVKVTVYLKTGTSLAEVRAAAIPARVCVLRKRKSSRLL